MGLTRIQSNTGSSFIQPEINGVVDVVLDPMIDWVRVNSKVYIENAGVYKVLNKTAFVYNLKLLTSVASSGTLIEPGLIYPIEEESSSTFWGGENGKEW